MSRMQNTLPGIYSGDFPPEYSAYNTQYPGAKETIEWVWYDTQSFVSASSVSLTFFQNGPGGRTIDQTNMEVAGQFAAPKAFFLRAIGFWVKQRPRSVARAAATNPQTGAFDNIAQLINTGTYSMVIGSKNYAIFPLHRLTAGAGANGVMTAEGATADPGAQSDYAQNGVADPRAMFTLSKPLFIAPQINFAVTITWPAAITLAGGNTDVQIFWDGDLIRPVQ